MKKKEHAHDLSIQLISEKAKNILKDAIFLNFLEGIGSIGLDENGGVSRLAFGPDDLKARKKIVSYMKDELNLDFRIDAWGNIFGRRQGQYVNGPVLMTGSHLDTVKNGGKFDGAAGIFCGLEMIRLFNVLDIKTFHPIEVVIFSAEEANQAGISTIGSRGITKRVTKNKLEKHLDDQGVPLLQAIESVGGDRNRMENDILNKGDVKAFIEIHNEQMPRLEDENKDLGIVLGVTGIRRRQYTVLGSAGHGGTIPMQDRRDALVAGAKLISKIQDIVIEGENDSVATVGFIQVEPNSVNVVPGKVVFGIEIRSYDSEEIDRIDNAVSSHADGIERDCNVKIIKGELDYNNQPREFSPMIRRTLSRATQTCKFTYMDIVSMAGHDAYHMSYSADSGMLFVPCKNGKSHCPEEYTHPKYLCQATQVLATTFLLIDKEE